jgi:alpha-mannosidase
MLKLNCNSTIMGRMISNLAKGAVVLAMLITLGFMPRGAANAQSPGATATAKTAPSAAATPAANGTPQSSGHVDLTKTPTLYVVNYAHLDTEWRWEYPQTIQEYLTKTMRDNFALFEKYPHYVFNFTGANR